MNNRSNGQGSVYRRRDGRYEAAIFVPTSDGTRKRIRLYDATRAGAEAKLVAARTKASQGILVPSADQRLAEYLDYWLRIAKQTRKPTTYISYESLVRIYLKPGLGTKRLTQLSVPDVQRHLDAQVAAGCGARTVQKQRTVLSAALARAQREELIVRNVARLVEVPESNRQRITPWTVAQLAAFLDHARTDPLYPVFVLLALYGLRIGEVLGLTRAGVDLSRDELHIRQQLQRFEGAFHLSPLKTSAGRRDLPLLEHARSVLTGSPHADSGSWRDLIFTTRFGNPIERGNVRRSFIRLTRAAGLPVIKVHHLRHTTATLLKNLRVPDRDIQLILGHAQIQTTQELYQHADLTGHRIALNDLQRALQVVTDGSRCRQTLPSNAPIGRRRRVAVSGSGYKTRTCDLRLMRPPFDTSDVPITEAATHAAARSRLAAVGMVAVENCRQDRQSAGWVRDRAELLRALQRAGELLCGDTDPYSSETAA